MDEFGDQGRCRSYVPADVFRRLKPEVQLLFRHCAVGAEDFLQPENQVKARRAKFVDQPHLRPSAPGSNAHIEVGGVGRDEWEAAHARLRMLSYSRYSPPSGCLKPFDERLID